MIDTKAQTYIDNYNYEAEQTSLYITGYRSLKDAVRFFRKVGRYNFSNNDWCPPEPACCIGDAKGWVDEIPLLYAESEPIHKLKQSIHTCYRQEETGQIQNLTRDRILEQMSEYGIEYEFRTETIICRYEDSGVLMCAR